MKKPPIVAPKPITDPQFKGIREVYVETLEQLATEYPAMKLPDWAAFNYMTGGFRVKEFSVFCGSTGAGKTTFLANLSAQLLKQRVKHFVMSVETGRHDYLRRIMSVLSGEDWNTGEAVPVEKLHAFDQLHGGVFNTDLIEFSLYEDRFSVEQLIHDIEFMVARGCKLAFVDNLNFFMEVTRAADAVVEMDRVIHELIMFCKRTDVHVVMVMHPNKGSGKNGSTRVETEFDIKGSSTAVQEAQNVFLWNRPKPEDVESGKRLYTDRELKLTKMRRRGIRQGSVLVFGSNGTSYVEKGFV